MRWTDRTPAVVGFYWQRGYGREPGLLRVVEVATSEVTGDGSLHVYVGGWEPGVPIGAADFERCEWAGPIPKPRGGLHLHDARTP